MITAQQMTNFLDLVEQDSMLAALQTMYREIDQGPTNGDDDGALMYASVLVQTADRLGIATTMDELRDAVRARWEGTACAKPT